MIRTDGKRICDKEIGHYTRGWHSCKRGAVVSVPSKHSVGMTLDYCAKHAPKQTLAKLEIVRLYDRQISFIGIARTLEISVKEVLAVLRAAGRIWEGA